MGKEALRNSIGSEVDPRNTYFPDNPGDSDVRQYLGTKAPPHFDLKFLYLTFTFGKKQMEINLGLITELFSEYA